jgi:hypothetical protein
MMPFDNLITTRLASKDSYRPCIPKPIASRVGPAPGPHNAAQFGNLDTGALADVSASVIRAVRSMPRGEDVLPAASADMLGGAQPAPVAPRR